MQAVLGNHCAQSPVSVWVASPGHALGHCKVKCTLISGQQVWWSLHWGLRQGWAGGWRLVGVAVLPRGGDFQRMRRSSATTAHRALPVFKGPALGMPWGTVGSNAASAL